MVCQFHHGGEAPHPIYYTALWISYGSRSIERTRFCARSNIILYVRTYAHNIHMKFEHLFTGKRHAAYVKLQK